MSNRILILEKHMVDLDEVQFYTFYKDAYQYGHFLKFGFLSGDTLEIKFGDKASAELTSKKLYEILKDKEEI